MVLQKLSSKKKIMLSFAILLIGSCRQILVKNYYIPEGFTGNVAVIYTGNLRKDNKEEDYNFIIPPDGILVVNDRFESGNYRINYYQKKNNSTFDTLFEELPSIKLDTMKNRIYFNRVLTFKKGEADIHITTFYIGKEKKSELGKNRLLFERELEKIVLKQ